MEVKISLCIRAWAMHASIIDRPSRERWNRLALNQSWSAFGPPHKGLSRIQPLPLNGYYSLTVILTTANPLSNLHHHNHPLLPRQSHAADLSNAGRTE